MRSTLDAVCVGEGEGAFGDLLGALSGGLPVEGIPNIVTARTGAAPPLRDPWPKLDALPFPDYELFYANSPMGAYPLKSFMAGRGCPYNCTYCFNARWRASTAARGRTSGGTPSAT
jgi:radical SAM superfamily enzyme YgiQ (UPF0313 family)